MSVGSVTNSSIAATYGSSNAVQPVKSQPEASEVKKSGPDHDGDSDDGGTQPVAQSAPKPTVNTNGQVIGSVLNVTA